MSAGKSSQDCCNGQQLIVTDSIIVTRQHHSTGRWGKRDTPENQRTRRKYMRRNRQEKQTGRRKNERERNREKGETQWKPKKRNNRENMKFINNYYAARGLACAVMSAIVWGACHVQAELPHGRHAAFLSSLQYSIGPRVRNRITSFFGRVKKFPLEN